MRIFSLSIFSILLLIFLQNNLIALDEAFTIGGNFAAKSEEALVKALQLSKAGDTQNLLNMFNSGLLVYLSDGQKVGILQKEEASNICKIIILDSDTVVWTTVNAIKDANPKASDQSNKTQTEGENICKYDPALLKEARKCFDSGYLRQALELVSKAQKQDPENEKIKQIAEFVEKKLIEQQEAEKKPESWEAAPLNSEAAWENQDTNESGENREIDKTTKRSKDDIIIQSKLEREIKRLDKNIEVIDRIRNYENYGVGFSSREEYNAAVQYIFNEQMKGN